VCAVFGGLALADNALEAMMLGHLKERLAVVEGLDQAYVRRTLKTRSPALARAPVAQVGAKVSRTYRPHCPADGPEA
jgi:hypothetical protein